VRDEEEVTGDVCYVPRYYLNGGIRVYDEKKAWHHVPSIWWKVALKLNHTCVSRCFPDTGDGQDLRGIGSS
jgi:hypothetical protein